MAAASERSYHHSVRHYHSPFPMDHRNSRPFHQRQTDAQRQAEAVSFQSHDAAQRARSYEEEHERQYEAQVAETNRFVTLYEHNCRGLDIARGAASSPILAHDPPTRHRAAKRQTNRTGIPGTMSHMFRGAAQGDHMVGPGMEPSSADSIGLNRSGGKDFPTFEPGAKEALSQSNGPLTEQESHRAWLAQKGLRFNAHRPRRVPYVSRDEFVDPLVSGSKCLAKGRVPCAYASVKPDPSWGPHVHQSYKPIGYRRAPAHCLEMPEKVNNHDPFHPPQRVDEESMRLLEEKKALLRLPATPLLQEVEERLKLKGLGSLTEVRHASDSAISELLRVCGFSGTQRMVILWELRKRFGGGEFYHPEQPRARTPR